MATSDAVDVTRHNFDAAAQNIKEALEECDFVAFDCEMTGLFLDNNESSYLDDMPLRYYKMHASARQFLVNQFGVAAFTRAADGGYTAKAFNLNIFPRSFQGSETRFTCQASSLEYLAQHRFDFNKMVYDGIPYLQLSQKRRLLQNADQPRKYFRREPRTAAAKALIERVQAAVRQWHAASAAPTLRVAEGCRPAERAWAYQALEELQLGDEGSPGFYVEKVGNNGPEVALLVTRASKAELAGHQQRLRQDKLDSIEAAAGFSRVVSLLQASGKPVVGHNMLFDLIYVLNIFVADFPTWPDFKAAAASWFPGGIYDTKHLTNALEARHQARGGYGDGSAAPLFDSTTLGDLYVALVEGRGKDSAGGQWRTLLDDGVGDGAAALPRVDHAEGFERYQGAAGAAFAHEAGFDAFMTGAVFAAMVELQRAADAADEPVLLQRPQQPAGARPEPSGDAVTARFDITPVAPLANRVHVMRMNAPYCVAGAAEDPQVRQRGQAVLATRSRGRLPDRKAAYSAFSGAAAEAGRVVGLRVEEVVATGPWAAWAVSTWGQDDPDAYVEKLVTVLKANSPFRKCQFMTWPEFEVWKGQFPESDPYGPRDSRSARDDGGSSGDEGGGILQSFLLGNNCTVM